MAFYNQNKNELLVLTGAVYSFVAYLTAFTLEVLFIIDLTKRSMQNEGNNLQASKADSSYLGDESSALNQARLALEAMQANTTIPCLAISILYFITFIASLIIIVALILRSTFCILVWMCLMTTLYLPEFGLIIYVSIYGWGVDTRNGQAELIFYLFRATLNVIFIYRAYKLFREWNYEKNFFMLKSNNRLFNGYDSPYFIGDSLTTTINPVFSSSTLNLNRYDHIRDFNNSTPATNNAPVFSEYHNNNTSSNNNFTNFNDSNDRGVRKASFTYSARRDDSEQANVGRYRTNSYNSHEDQTSPQTLAARPRSFYLAANPQERDQVQRQQAGDVGRFSTQMKQDIRIPSAASAVASRRLPRRQNSALSIEDNDDFAEYEMDLDYRTLTNQRKYFHQQQHQDEPLSNSAGSRQAISRVSTDSGHFQGPTITTTTTTASNTMNRASSSGPLPVSYSTQSLDRRHLRDMDYTLPEQVILRPLGHQPFDYLQRPGSTSNLSSIQNLNTHPTNYSSTTKLAKRSQLDLHDHRYDHHFNDSRHRFL